VQEAAYSKVEAAEQGISDKKAVKEEGLDEFEIEKRKIGDEVGRSRGGGVPHSQPTATRQR